MSINNTDPYFVTAALSTAGILRRDEVYIRMGEAMLANARYNTADLNSQQAYVDAAANFASLLITKINSL